MTQLAGWLSSHAAALSIVGVAVTWMVSTILQIAQRRAEAREREFQAFHKIMAELLSSPSEEKSKSWYAVAVSIYEMRHFPRYYEFTERMLIRMKENTYDDPNCVIVTKEIELTLKYIQQNK
jgi:hypothetical protein